MWKYHLCRHASTSSFSTEINRITLENETKLNWVPNCNLLTKKQLLFVVHLWCPASKGSNGGYATVCCMVNVYKSIFWQLLYWSQHSHITTTMNIYPIINLSCCVRLLLLHWHLTVVQKQMLSTQDALLYF